MKSILATIVLAAATAAPAAAAPPVVPTTPGQLEVGSLTASLSSPRAGARPVVLTLRVHTYLVCGQPGPIVVRFPTGSTLPATLTPAAVLVNNAPAAAVAVHLRQVTITPARRSGITCNAVAPGLVTLRFTSSAQLGNPASAGTYTITVTHRRATYRTAVRVLG